MGVIQQMGDVGFQPCHQIIQAKYVPVARDQALAEVRAQKARTAGDQCPHGLSSATQRLHLILFMLAPADSRLVCLEPLPALLPIGLVLTIVARGASTATPFA